MSTNDSNPFEWNWSDDLEGPHANQREETIEHLRIRNGDEPDELVLIPADATETELQTVWIQANGAGDGFVDLEDAR